jgi:alpha-D-ribose 1-methylphosphonate 5-triphosphate synthase subunit PhnH
MKATSMTFHDCLTAATLAAVDQDVPAWLLPATILNQAAQLTGCDRDSDVFAN